MRINGHSILIPVGEKWNPLESVGAAPEYIPPTWDGPHTSLRLIQAFKTLSAIPVANGPRFKSSWWPHHPMEWIDIKAKEHEYLNDLDQAREAVRQWARTRHRASPEEVSRMEAALSWPARYLHHRPLVMRVVQTVARFRSMGYESDKIAQRLHKPAATSGVSIAPGSPPLLPGFAVTPWGGILIAVAAGEAHWHSCHCGPRNVQAITAFSLATMELS